MTMDRPRRGDRNMPNDERSRDEARERAPGNTRGGGYARDREDGNNRQTRGPAERGMSNRASEQRWEDERRRTEESAREETWRGHEPQWFRDQGDQRRAEPGDRDERRGEMERQGRGTPSSGTGGRPRREEADPSYVEQGGGERGRPLQEGRRGRWQQEKDFMRGSGHDRFTGQRVSNPSEEHTHMEGHHWQEARSGHDEASARGYGGRPRAAAMARSRRVEVLDDDGRDGGEREMRDDRDDQRDDPDDEQARQTRARRGDERKPMADGQATDNRRRVARAAGDEDEVEYDEDDDADDQDDDADEEGENEGGTLETSPQRKRGGGRKALARSKLTEGEVRSGAGMRGQRKAKSTRGATTAKKAAPAKRATKATGTKRKAAGAGARGGRKAAGTSARGGATKRGTAAKRTTKKAAKGRTQRSTAAKTKRKTKASAANRGGGRKAQVSKRR